MKRLLLSLSILFGLHASLPAQEIEHFKGGVNVLSYTVINDLQSVCGRRLVVSEARERSRVDTGLY